MSTLHLSRGLPGSGKTTACREFIKGDNKIVRINRDDIRWMLYGEYWGGNIDEDTVTFVQYAIMDAALAAGKDVYCDDMNISELATSHLEACVSRHPGTEVVWHDHTGVPLEVCQERDARRDRVVGADVIADLHRRYIK